MNFYIPVFSNIDVNLLFQGNMSISTHCCVKILKAAKSSGKKSAENSKEELGVSTGSDAEPLTKEPLIITKNASKPPVSVIKNCCVTLVDINKQPYSNLMDITKADSHLLPPDDVIIPEPVTAAEEDVVAENALSIFDLDDHCLSNIFIHLDTIDLINAALTTNRFYQVINQTVVRHKSFRFVEIKNSFSVRKILRLFGKNITELEFWLDDIQYESAGHTRSETVLKLIKKHCSPDKLRRLYIGIKLADVSTRIKDAFAPMFVNVQQCWIGHNQGTHVDSSSSFEDVIEFLATASNLEELIVQWVDSNSRTRTPHTVAFTKLRKLAILNSVFAHTETIEKLFTSNPNITSLEFGYVRGLDKLIVKSIEYFPNLEKFQTYRPMDYSELKEHVFHDNILHLKKLKLLLVPSMLADCTDIICFIEKLAIKNTVERLRIGVGLSYVLSYNIMTFNSVDTFTNLKALTIYDPNSEMETFLIGLFKLAPNVEECSLIASKVIPQSIVIWIVKNGRRLSKLALSSPKMKITKPFYLKLHDARLSHRGASCLVLNVGKNQAREFFKMNLAPFYDERVLKIAEMRREMSDYYREDCCYNFC